MGVDAVLVDRVVVRDVRAGLNRNAVLRAGLGVDEDEIGRRAFDS